MDRYAFDARRHFLRTALATSAWVMTGSLLAPLVHAFGQVPRKLPPGRSIYDLKGKVSVDGQTANKKTTIAGTSLVETGSNSFVIFAVGQDAYLLRENSRLQLSRESTVQDAMRLVTGKVLSVFGARGPGQVHTVNTTTATIGIRGTGLYAESESDYSYVCTCYGTVDLSAQADSTVSERITSKHHDAPRYILTTPDGGKLITPAPVKNHTDEELMLIEALVGRIPPFSPVQSYSSPRRGY